MTVTLHATDKIVQLVTASGKVSARIWEGHTASGIACHAYVTRIAPAVDDDAAEFERELIEQRKPTPAIAAIPLRLIL